MRLAISQQKGGAGKTTTAINLGGALNSLGCAVLVIDLDPQGHATEGLGFADHYESASKSLFDILPDIERTDEFEDLIQPHYEMDVIPAHEDMINLEDALSGVPNRENRLGLALDTLEYDYDFVLIDCPPNLGVLTDNAILAAENAVIPAETNSTSIRAIELLFKQFGALESAFKLSIDEVALVANEVGTDGEDTEMMQWFKDRFESKERCPVFEIRKRVALQRAWNNGVSIFEHEETIDMEERYLELAEHVRGYND